MKKYAMLLLAAVFTFSSVITAQEQVSPQGRKGEKKEFKRGGTPQVSAEKRAEFMAKQLELTDAEKVKVQELMEKQASKREQHQAEMKKVREEQQLKFEAERKAHKAELEKIIGKEKFQKLETMQSERMERVKSKRGNYSNNSGCCCCQQKNMHGRKMMKRNK
jgi:hypothetical protein